jgi:hypothetical protein
MSLGEFAREFIMEAWIIGGLVLVVVVGAVVVWEKISSKNQRITYFENWTALCDKNRSRVIDQYFADQVRLVELGKITDRQSSEIAELQGVVAARNASHSCFASKVSEQ